MPISGLPISLPTGRGPAGETVLAVRSRMRSDHTVAAPKTRSAATPTATILKVATCSSACASGGGRCSVLWEGSWLMAAGTSTNPRDKGRRSAPGTCRACARWRTPPRRRPRRRRLHPEVAHLRAGEDQPDQVDEVVLYE